MGMPLNNKLQLLKLVLLLIHHHFHVNALAVESSNCNAITCANLGNNIPYPFASSASPSSCAPSSSFHLDNCSSPQAYWDAFTTTIAGSNPIGPPAVMGISRVNSSTYINLTWDSDLISHPNNRSSCSPPVPLLKNLIIPPAIDLTTFKNNSFGFSSNNVYLLFNCSQSTPDDIEQLMSSLSFNAQGVLANTSLCQSYREQCTLVAGYYTAQCIQLIQYPIGNYWPSTQLDIQHAMQSLGCTHFQFFLTKNGANDVAIMSEWSKAILQLQWTIPDCLNCIESGGSCRLDSTNRTLEDCTCQNGKVVSGPPDYCNSGPSTVNIKRFTEAAIILGIVLSFLLAFCCCYCWWRIGRRTSKKSIEKLTKFRRKSAWPRQEPTGPNESLNDLDLNGLSERPMEYSYSSIASATSSFSNVVGEGGFGVVFKGAFSTNITDHQHRGELQEIAVKVLEVRSKQSRKQFLNEVAIIGRIHHVNVVRLLGFCVQQEEHEMLVYEYVVNGSLDTWLFSSSKGAAEKKLEWEQRYAIAVGIAKGLSYLHEECRHRIVHCDIKPQNILLDACMCPKIADFGLARLMSRDDSRVVTLAKGTPGYMAPEFWVGGDIQLSTKADVYSYGMVLLELVSGRRNFALGCRRFPAVACEAAMRGDFESVVDTRLHTPVGEEHWFLMWQQVRTAVFVALWCIQENPASRPCMSEVVQYLEGIAAVSEQPPWPAIASTSTTPPINNDSTRHLQDLTPISEGR